MPNELIDPVKVGQDERGATFLVAERADIESGESNGPAQIVYSDGTMGEIAPLQQFYKFGVWFPVEDTQ